MKLSLQSHHGKDTWRVSYKEQGKYKQRWFSNKADAQAFIGSVESEMQDYGDVWIQASDFQKLEMITAFKMAQEGGYRLTEALAAYERQRGVKPSTFLLKQACDDFMKAKEAKGIRKRSLYQLKWTIEEFRKSLPPDAKLIEADASAAQAWLHNPEWSQRTRKGRLIDLANFFNWCVKMGYLLRAPTDQVERPIVEKRKIGILTVDQSRKLMDHVRDTDPGMLGFFALSLFAGIRPESEIRRMEDDAVDFEQKHVTVEADAKTRRRRIVTLRPNCIEWLAIWKTQNESAWPTNAYRRWVRLRTATINPWPQDCLRHSFCSYHYAMWGEQETVTQAGHSAQQLHEHYRALVTKQEAELFWQIKPKQ